MKRSGRPMRVTVLLMPRIEQRLDDEAGEPADDDVVLGGDELVDRGGEVGDRLGVERLDRRHVQDADAMRRASPAPSAASSARSVMKPVEMMPTSLPSRSCRALPISKR